MRPTSSFSQLELQFVNFCLKADGDKIRFREIEGGRIEVAFAAADRPAAHESIGKSVILGICPEDLEVAKFSRKEGKALASGFRAIVEPTGAETNLYLQTGAHTLVCRSQGALDYREAAHRFQFEMNLEKAISSIQSRPTASTKGSAPRLSSQPHRRRHRRR